MSAAEEPVLPSRNLAFATQVVPAAAYAGAIFYAGLIHMGELPELGFVPTDKLLHAVVFGGLALLLARAAHWLRPLVSLRKTLLFSAWGASLLGLFLELCQAFVPYRSADGWDWVADTIGAMLASGIAFAVLLWRARRSPG